MFFPLISVFQSQFLAISEKEMELMMDHVFEGRYSKLNPRTKEAFIQGKAKTTKNLLARVVHRGSEFISLLDKLVSPFKGEGRKYTALELDEVAMNAMEQGFRAGHNQSECVEFERLLAHIKQMKKLSLHTATLYQKKDYVNLRAELSHQPPFPDFWADVSLEEIEKYDGDHPVIAMLIFRGFMYQLALVEAFLLSGNSSIDESGLVKALIRAPYCSGNNPPAPLKRFFLFLAYDDRKQKTPSLNDIARVIGLAKLKHRRRVGKRLKFDDEQLLLMLDSASEEERKLAEDSLLLRQDSWLVDFRRDLSPTKKKLGKTVANLYPAKKAKFLLDEVLLQNPKNENASIELYWFLFFAARALNSLWWAFELEKDTNPKIKQAMPEGIEGLLLFYENAFAHAQKIIRGE